MTQRKHIVYRVIMAVKAFCVANVFILNIVVIVLVGLLFPNSFCLLNLLNLIVHFMPNLAKVLERLFRFFQICA